MFSAKMHSIFKNVLYWFTKMTSFYPFVKKCSSFQCRIEELYILNKMFVFSMQN